MLCWLSLAQLSPLLSFNLFPSILTFDFDLVLGLFLTYLGSNWLFLGSFSVFPSILTFDFDLIWGSCLAFWGPNGLFLGLWKRLNTVLGSTHVVEELSFFMFSSILIFDFYLILG